MPPVYKKGDKIVIEGPEIVLEETDALCIHALVPQTLRKFDQNASLNWKNPFGDGKAGKRIVVY